MSESDAMRQLRVDLERAATAKVAPGGQPQQLELELLEQSPLNILSSSDRFCPGAERPVRVERYSRAMFIVTRCFTFHSAHWLPGHPTCGAVHGHSYRLEVTVGGEVIDGMVMDFAKLKEIVQRVLLGLDHGVANVWLNGGRMVMENDGTGARIEKCTGLPPTAENLAAAIGGRIWMALPGHLYLKRVKLWETETSSAEVTYE